MNNGWEVKDLDDVCYFENGDRGKNYPSKKHYISSGIPFITAANVANGFILDNLNYISEERFNLLSRGKFRKNDFLFCLRGSLGKFGYVHEDITGGIASSMVIVRTANKIIDKWLHYYFISSICQNEIDSRKGGAAQPNLGAKDLKKFQIPVPPLEQQQQIVAILDEAFEAIEQAQANIEKNIENAKELFDSKKEDLFDRLSSESQVIPIEEACEKIFAGGDAPKESFSKVKTEEFFIPIIANAVKKNGLYGYTNEAKVIKPSITIAARGSGTGHTEYRDYPFVPIVRLIVLTPNDEVIDVEYLMHAIKSLTILRSGSAIPQLTVPMIKGYSIPVPSKLKQLDIVDTLNKLELTLENYISILNSKIISLDELKKSLLEKAFAGELTYKDMPA